MTDYQFSECTLGIIVTVTPIFLEEQSEPDENRFVWAYRVRIRNTGLDTVQLLRRTWVITDGRGQVAEVEGPGVVGETPVLEAGDDFEYTSGTPLSTPSGFMRGSYRMVRTATGEPFDVAIPCFSLDSPRGNGRLH